MADDQIWGCDFTIKGPKIPPELIEKVMQATAVITGVKGHIEQVKDGVYQGHIEGKKAVVEKYKQLVEKAEELRGQAEKIAFEKLKQIQNTEITVFEVRTKK